MFAASVMSKGSLPNFCRCSSNSLGLKSLASSCSISTMADNKILSSESRVSIADNCASERLLPGLIGAVFPASLKIILSIINKN